MVTPPFPSQPEAPPLVPPVLPMALQVVNLAFGHSGSGKVLYSNLSFSVPSGGLLCLAGMNGCGKTTLLCLLAGIMEPQAGSIALVPSFPLASQEPPTQSPQLVAGQEALLLHAHAQKLPKSLHGAPLREHSALVLQDADMQIIGSTVGEDMLLTALPLAQKATGEKRQAMPLAEAKARAMLRPFALENMWHTPVQHLSYGQKRKLCLATALLRSPSLLLLDEPLSGLDYPAMRELLGLVATCRQNGVCVVLSSHDLDPFVGLANDFLFLHPVLPPLLGTPAALAPAVQDYGVKPYEQ